MCKVEDYRIEQERYRIKGYSLYSYSSFNAGHLFDDTAVSSNELVAIFVQS